MEKGDRGHTSALYVWNGMSVFWGTSFHTNPHFHNTLQLVFDIDKEFLVKDASSDWVPYSAAIIRASQTHQLDSNGSIQLFIYLDNESHFARELTEKYLFNKNINNLKDSGIRNLSNEFFKRLLVISNCDTLFDGCVNILNHLIHVDNPSKTDDRIEKAISFITNVADKQIKVKVIADHVCLSESRLRHLFKEQVGQPIQNFILWMKVVDSLNLILKGNQITKTAHETGFWDSSHMNRSYRELLGATPGAIKKYEDDIRVVSCGNKNLYTIKTEILKNWNDNQPFRVVQL